MMNLVGNHLWQSTLFAVAAALLTLLFRKNHARVRYWLWLAASIKFLIPFSLFIAIGSSLDVSWRHGTQLPPMTISYVENISQPFGTINSSPVIPEATKQNRINWIPIFLYATWLCGFIGVSLLYLTRGRRLRMVLHRAQPLRDGRAQELLRKIELSSGLRIKLASSASSMEPGVLGIFRPVLLLPEGMIDRLDDSELEAIIAHEVMHVRRHDNFISAIHMLIEALFWFHPMIWWLGARLVQERERACDEAVLQSGKDPQTYAEAILKVCEFYVESPLACVAGVTGSNIKSRIQAIISRTGSRLSLTKKLILATAGIVALGFPVVIGLFNTSSGQAQSQTMYKPSFEAVSIKVATDTSFSQAQSSTESKPSIEAVLVKTAKLQMPDNAGIEKPKPSFEVASIKVAESCSKAPSGVRMKIPGGTSYQPGGRYTTCSQLRYIIMEAYQMDPLSEWSGVPGWSNDILYKIEAKAEGNPDKEQMHLMVQSLLEERFKLKLHRKTQEMEAYSLVVAKGGPKLQPAKDAQGNPVTSLSSDEEGQKKLEEMEKAKLYRGLLPPGGLLMATTRASCEFMGRAASMEKLAAALHNVVGNRRVIDRTGLTGLYDFRLTFANPYQQAPPGADGTAPSAEFSAPTIFTALQEQLGLKLVQDKASFESIVIDSVEKPPEN